MGRIAVTSAFVIAVAALLPAQDQRPVFRAATRLIVQSVTVKDARGHSIEGLRAEDFEVTEDGQLQKVTLVEYQRLSTDADAKPRLLPLVDAATAVVSGVTRTQIRVPPPGDARFRGRRLLVLYLDFSTMTSSDRTRAISGALTYVERHLAASDAVAVVTFDGGAVRVREDFTDDRERLVARLQILAAGDDANRDGLPDDAEGTAFGENDAEFNLFNTDRQLAALQTAIADLRPIPEQKTLVYFGSGLRMNGADNMAQVRATVNAAVRANVTINPIDARGLVAMAPMGDATRAVAGGAALFSGALAQNLGSRLQRSQDTLYSLAKDTGGEVFIDRNDLALGVVQAAGAATDYYLVGYYSTHTADDGRFRRVRVTLRGHPGADLRYRDGYVADRAYAKFTSADKERQLEDALRSDEPITLVPMAVEINAFRLSRAEYYVPVAVKIPGRELALAGRGGAARTLIDVVGEVKDDHGTTHRNLRDKLDISLDPARAQEWSVRPILYETGFTLLPGAYVLKLLVRDATTGRIGTYQTPFTIPNLEREDGTVPISTVVLAGQRVAAGEALFAVRQKVSADAANPLIVGGQRLLPSVTRVFSVTRDLHVFLHAYRTATVMPFPIVSYVGLYRDDVKVRESPAITAADADPKSGAVPLVFDLALGGLEPGSYECQVTVVSPGSSRATFWRAPITLVR